MIRPLVVVVLLETLTLLGTGTCSAQQSSAAKNVVQGAPLALPQTTAEPQRMQLLQAQMQALERQMAEDQRQLSSLQTQLRELEGIASEQGQVPENHDTNTAATGLLQEQQAATSSQVATLNQEKVETESKFPLRLHGTLLMSAFVNSGSVDQPASPTAAFGGPGDTGFSVRQTSLGLSADGPHVYGAESHADVDVDFFGTAAAGPQNSGGLLRLRTAHAALTWQTAEAYFALDRPVLSPYRPQSLLAVATPELAWSGNLWAWNPQLGLAYHHGTTNRFGVEAALIDAADPYGSSITSTGTSTSTAVSAPSLSEASRWPGLQTRFSLEHASGDRAVAVGVGGYYSPHLLRLNGGGAQDAFTAWATSLDLRLSLSHRLQVTGTAYRGAGLGGLGGGGYRDYVYRQDGEQLRLIALDDVGGWLDVHQSLSQQLSWNVGLGIDNPFAGQLRAYPGVQTGNPYGDIARNRTVFSNVIYAPRAYLLFSAEYRNLHTAPVTRRLWTSNVAGFGAAYRF